MKAIQFERFKGPLEVAHVADPTPAPDGVVVRVLATGVCRSDWHGWQGHDAMIALPHVPGHELAGEVVAVGRDVRRLRVGARVTVPFVSGCGSCPLCRRGEPQVCDAQFQPGFSAWGSFAEYVALRYADLNVVELPEGLDPVAAASLGCRFGTSYRAVVELGQLRPGEWLAVFGCGGVGLSAIMLAEACGARSVAVDVDPARLALARSLGAAHVIDARDGDTAEAVRARVASGVEVSMDALGDPTTLAASIRSLAKRGRHLQVGLLAGEHALAAVPMDQVVARELVLHGCHGVAASAYPAMLQWVRDGVIDPAQLVGRRIALEDAPAALRAMTTYPAASDTADAVDQADHTGQEKAMVAGMAVIDRF